MEPELPVLDDWDGYVFPEGGLDAAPQRLMVKDPWSNPPSGSFAPCRLDDAQDGLPGTMMKTLIAVSKKLQNTDDVAGLALNGEGSDVRWFLFSPYEVFLEEVLAERMKTLEIGELR